MMRNAAHYRSLRCARLPGTVALIHQIISTKKAPRAGAWYQYMCRSQLRSCPQAKMADAASAELQGVLAPLTLQERKRREQAIEATEAMHKFAKNMFFSDTKETCTFRTYEAMNLYRNFETWLKVVLGAPKQGLSRFKNGFGIELEIKFAPLDAFL